MLEISVVLLTNDLPELWRYNPAEYECEEIQSTENSDTPIDGIHAEQAYQQNGGEDKYINHSSRMLYGKYTKLFRYIIEKS